MWKVETFIETKSSFGITSAKTGKELMERCIKRAKDFLNKENPDVICPS